MNLINQNAQGPRGVGRIGIALLAVLALVVVSSADEIAPPTFVVAFGEQGTGDGQFKAPIGIAINADDEIFVSDAHNKCVQRFTREGKFVDKFSTGAFPGGIAVDGQGLVYVAAMMDHKISVFRPPQPHQTKAAAPASYELVREWGKKGNADGELDQPGGLAFGRDGTLYVCDQINHRVQRFRFEKH